MMKTNHRARMSIVAALAIAITLGGGLLVAEAPSSGEKAKPSSYAPIQDLDSQFAMYLSRLEEDLANGDDYGEDQISRVSRDANTLAVLALVVGMHDSQSKLKASAAKLIELATDLADSADDYDQASKALAELNRTIASAPSAEKLEWQSVGDIQQLMMQVPIVNNSLRRGVTGRRFSRSVEKNAGYAATLAAIAQASMLDTNYCGDEEDEAKWIAICLDMRFAAAEVGAAVRRMDQPAAKVGLAKLVKTCDACHEDFRD